jgi:hypothetical protein
MNDELMFEYQTIVIHCRYICREPMISVIHMTSALPRMWPEISRFSAHSKSRIAMVNGLGEEAVICTSMGGG